MKSAPRIILITGLLIVGYLQAQDEPGFTYEYGYTSDLMMVAGVERGAHNLNYLDNVDLLFGFNTEGLGLWSGGTLSAYFLSNQGAALTEVVGDAQTTSNIEADGTQRLYEIWYNQSFLFNTIDVLVGVHDLNSEFYTNETSGLFTNSSFGIGADVAGTVPVSIFNVVAPAVRLKLRLTRRLWLLGAVYDGNPDNDHNTDGLHIKWDGEEGLFSVVEAQLDLTGADERPRIYRVAGWNHSAPGGVDSDPISGFYFSLDQPLGKLNTFLRGGVATGEAEVPLSISFGGHTENYLGLAVAPALLRNAEDTDGDGEGDSDAWEVVIEATWAIEINDMFSIQPDIQFVLNPSGAGGDAVVVYGVRTSIGF